MATKRQAERAVREAFPSHSGFSVYEGSMVDERGRKNWEVVLYPDGGEGEDRTAYVHEDGAVEGPY